MPRRKGGDTFGTRFQRALDVDDREFKEIKVRPFLTIRETWLTTHRRISGKEPVDSSRASNTWTGTILHGKGFTTRSVDAR